MGLRIPHYRAHPGEEAGGRLVRDHLGKLHGGWRTSAGHPRPDPRAIPRGPARRVDVFRLRRAAQSRTSAPLEALVKRTKTPWLTDHLCWGSVDGRYTHDLLPMPYTFEAAKLTARKIREARDFLEVPIAVENVSSYAEFHVSEMTEWEFLNEVVERADCGILLDVNNIYVSSRNHSFDPYEYLNSVPAGTRGADPHRRPLQIREVHPGHARPSGDRPRVEALRARHPPRRRRPPRCSNGTTAFPPSTKCTPRR